jgi:hypothetical protein
MLTTHASPSCLWPLDSSPQHHHKHHQRSSSSSSSSTTPLYQMVLVRLVVEVRLRSRRGGGKHLHVHMVGNSRSFVLVTTVRGHASGSRSSGEKRLIAKAAAAWCATTRPVVSWRRRWQILWRTLLARLVASRWACA